MWQCSLVIYDNEDDTDKDVDIASSGMYGEGR